MRRLTLKVLGEFEAGVDGRSIRVTASKLRTILVALAMSAGQTVSIERLADVVWGEHLPVDARRSLQTYVGRLRRLLGPELLVFRPGGYMLDVGADSVDALEFERRLDAVQEATAGEQRALLEEALELWHGEPFAGVVSDRLSKQDLPRLTDRYLRAVELLADLDIADGLPERSLKRLEELATRFPLRESLSSRLLSVLAMSGRPAEALQRYEQVRVMIADELGVDLSPELREIHTDLLKGVVPPPRRISSPVRPRQLPPSVIGFSGRDRQLKTLDEQLGRAGSGAAIAVVTGAAGVGKTTLAVRWAHHAAGSFPDGQLYIDLRGFTPAGEPVAPLDAVQRFLNALDVPFDGALDLETHSALFRSATAGRQMIVLLDNARDANHVRPLLPGAGSVVVVTSRDRLAGLVASHNARPVGLDLLDDHEALRLLHVRVDGDPGEDSAALNEIIGVCAGLPLALAVAGARAATGASLRELADELRESHNHLDVLDAGDASTSLRAVLSASYRAIDSSSARLFRLLALHPGPDVSLHAAASLAALPVRETKQVLNKLTALHLLFEPSTGRYGFHDLISTYATELLHHVDSHNEQNAATLRLLDHYLHSSAAADRMLNTAVGPTPLEPPCSGVEIERPDGHHTAITWLRTEHQVLVALVRHAADTGHDVHAAKLAQTLGNYLDMQGHWQDWESVAETGAAAGARGGDLVAEARLTHSLSQARRLLGRLDGVDALLSHALELYTQAGDDVGRAQTHHAISHWLGGNERYTEALPAAERALADFEAAGHTDGQAWASNSVGWYHSILGDHRTAIAYCEQALDLMRDTDHRGRGLTWNSLGHAHRGLGHLDQALACYRNALDMSSSSGNRLAISLNLAALGDTQLVVGDSADAHDSYRRALEILEELGHPKAALVRAKLASGPG